MKTLLKEVGLAVAEGVFGLVPIRESEIARAAYRTLRVRYEQQTEKLEKLQREAAASRHSNDAAELLRLTSVLLAEKAGIEMHETVAPAYGAPLVFVLQRTNLCSSSASARDRIITGTVVLDGVRVRDNVYLSLNTPHAVSVEFGGKTKTALIICRSLEKEQHQ